MSFKEEPVAPGLDIGINLGGLQSQVAHLTQQLQDKSKAYDSLEAENDRIRDLIVATEKERDAAKKKAADSEAKVQEVRDEVKAMEAKAAEESQSARELLLHADTVRAGLEFRCRVMSQETLDTEDLIADQQAQLIEEIGKATVARIRMNLERESHEVTLQQLEDSNAYLLARRTEEVESLRQELVDVELAHRDELLMLERAHADREQELLHDIEGLQLEVEQLRDVGVLPSDEEMKQIVERIRQREENSAKAIGNDADAEPSITVSSTFIATDEMGDVMDKVEAKGLRKELRGLREELVIAQEQLNVLYAEIRRVEGERDAAEEEVQREMGRNTMDRLGFAVAKWELENVRNELSDTVSHMEAFYTDEVRFLRRRMQAKEEEFEEEVRMMEEQHNQEVLGMEGEIETLKMHVEDMEIQLDLAHQETKDAIADAEIHVHAAQVSGQLAQAELDLQPILEKEHTRKRALEKELQLIHLEKMGKNANDISDTTLMVQAQAATLAADLASMRLKYVEMKETTKRMLNEGMNDVAFATASMAQNILKRERADMQAREMKRIEESERARGVLEGTIATLKGKLKQSLELVKKLTLENDLMMAETGGSEEEIAKLEQDLADIAFLADSAHQEKEAMKMDFEDKSNQLEEMASHVEGLSKGFEEARLEITEKNQELRDLTMLVQHVEDQLLMSDRGREKAVAERDAALADASLAREEKAALELEAQQLRQERTEAELVMDKLRARNLQLSKINAATKREIQSTRDVVSKVLGLEKGVTKAQLVEKGGRFRKRQKKKEREAGGDKPSESGGALTQALHDYISKLEGQLKAQEKVAGELNARISKYQESLEKSLGETTRLVATQTKLRATIAEARVRLTDYAQAYGIPEKKLVSFDAIVNQGFVIRT